MDYKKKYLKYKTKYLQLNKLIGGKEFNIDSLDNDSYLKYLENIQLVSSQDTWNINFYGDKLIFSYSPENIEESIKKINLSPLLHSYPTVHTSWGTLVNPHSEGSWDFSDIVIITKAK